MPFNVMPTMSVSPNMLSTMMIMKTIMGNDEGNTKDKELEELKEAFDKMSKKIDKIEANISLLADNTNKLDALLMQHHSTIYGTK